MAVNSLETALESYFIELLRTDARLKGKHIVHSDNDAKAKLNAIVISAVQGEPELEGVAGFNADVTLEYRGGVRSTAAQNDLTAAAMSEVIMTANSRVTSAQQLFSPFWIRNERMSSERPDSRTSRKRVVKVPVVAKLK